MVVKLCVYHELLVYVLWRQCSSSCQKPSSAAMRLSKLLLLSAHNRCKRHVKAAAVYTLECSHGRWQYQAWAIGGATKVGLSSRLLVICLALLLVILVGYDRQ